jgi:hypothetical protein
MRARLFCLALLAAACAAPAGAQSNVSPAWLSGYWLSCDGRETAENWIGADGAMLLGTNWSGDAFEFLRIAPNERGGLSYYSMPNGRSPPTEFAMVSNTGQRAVFENLSHDFPQRIIYERTGDALHARIEDAGGAQGMDWRFRRAEPDARCAR